MNEAQQKTQEARFRDMMRRAQRSCREVYSDFLDPQTQRWLMGLAGSEGLEAKRYGGSADCERAVVGMYVPGCQEDSEPIAVVRLSWDGRYASITHRDVLGAYLALGFERSTLGDIRIEGENAYLVLLPSVAQYILANLSSVGRAAVHAERYTGSLPEAEKGVLSTVNISSLRMDALLAQTLHYSRAKAQDVIKGGLVCLNWQENDHTDAAIGEGDMISVRGHGRIRVLQVQGESRKGRLFLQVETFLKP